MGTIVTHGARDKLDADAQASIPCLKLSVYPNRCAQLIEVAEVSARLV